MDEPWVPDVPRGAPCVPEVLRGEGSVQVGVHVSAALLHGLRVGDERLGLDSLPLYLGAVLHPQVNQRHAGHLVPVRSPENCHPARLRDAHAAAVRGHGLLPKLRRIRMETRRLFQRRKFPGEASLPRCLNAGRGRALT